MVCVDICKTALNFVIEIGQLATIDGVRIASDLEDLSGCSPTAGQCFLGDSIVVWDPHPLKVFL